MPPDAPFDRIEVWFKPAYVVCLPVHLDGMTIDDATHESTADATRVMGRGLQPWENAYVVTTTDRARGWVIGGSVTGRG